MRGFVKGIAVVILVTSGLAALIGLLMLLGGNSEEKGQALIILACAVFGCLNAAVSWVLMDIANALAPKLKAEDEPRSFARGGTV